MDRKKLTPLQRRCFVDYLGITEDECPPNLYRLLDLPVFESDSSAIREAIRKRRSLVSHLSVHSNSDDAAQLEKLLRRAGTTLLEVEKKQQYDKKLRARLSEIDGRAGSPHITRRHGKSEQPSGDEPGRRAVSTIDETNNQFDSREVVSGTDGVSRTNNVVSRTELRQPVHQQQHATTSDPLEIRTYGTRRRSFIGQRSMALFVGLAVASIGLVALAIFVVKGGDQDPDTSRASATSSDVPVVPDPGGSGEVAEDEKDDKDPGERTDNQVDGSETDVVEAEEPDHERVTDQPPKIVSASEEPFVGLDKEFELPRIGEARSNDSEFTTPGKLAPSALETLKMSLNGEATDFDGVYGFQIRNLGKKAEGSARLWQVLATPAENQPGRETQLGHFFVDSDHHLRYVWDIKPAFARAEQLANSQLVLESGDKTHTIQLRRAIHRERHPTHLRSRDIEVPLAIPDPPAAESLFLQLQASQGISHTTPIEIPLRGERKSMLVDDDGKVQLEFAFDVNRKKELAFVMYPKVEKTTDRRSPLVARRWAEIKSEIQVQQSRITTQIGKLIGASSRLVVNVQRRNELQRRLRAVLDTPRPNPFLANSLGEEINGLTGMIKRDLKTQKIMREEIPKSYGAYVKKLRVAQIAGKVHNEGEFEYRLVARTSQGDIQLLVADGHPAEERKVVPIPAFELAGKWIRLSNGWVYQLSGGGQGGSVTIENVFTGQRVATGRWSRRDKNVSISVGRVVEQYELHEEVLLKGRADNALYRQF